MRNLGRRIFTAVLCAVFLFLVALAANARAGGIGVFADPEAEILAMEVSGKLLPPPSLYEQIRSDLAAIRQAYPAMASIRHRPRWQLGVLILVLAAKALEQRRSLSCIEVG